ncbi:uncharacterized protein SPSC_02230 [Sporisorium scitamineum]|uniref:Uncharacterized protein n=1 Tax=Sporisorium scitamineum TaxID=49012 RepID=A0A0F7S0H9_9BASI|nr:hypothetical protein [Sporisorium scitamineum]CDU23601.1 uncharacterized protein SPSC_02230 [Sporisorium scitamineum]
MPSIPAAAAVTMPGDPSRMASRMVQLFRGPSLPVDFPASIVSGLSSTNPGVQRAAIAELRAYVKRLFFLDFATYFYTNSLVTAGIICLLVVIGLPVAGHRLYHKRLNPIRVEKRAQGSYLVPNAINCFLLLEGFYGILTVAFNFVTWQLFHNHRGGFVKIFQAARCLIWIPLYIGALLTGWGSFYTAPGALDKPTAARHKTSAKGHLPWSLIVNLSCWGVPVALIISLLPPVCLSSLKMHNTYKDWQQWDNRFQALLSSTLAGALVDQAAVNDFRSQAYTIFTNWTQSYYYIDIGYVLWGFWALLFLVFYVPAGGVLVYLLYRQVVRQRGILLSYQQKLEAQLAQETRHTHLSVLTGESRVEPSSRLPAGLPEQARSRPVWSAAQPSSALGAPLEDIYEDRGASDDSRGARHSGGGASYKSAHEIMGLESALRQDPSPVHGVNTPGFATRNGQVASWPAENDEANGSPTIVPKSPSAFRRLIRLDTKTSSNRGGAGQNSSRSIRRRRLSITGGPMSRYKYLRRCLINLLILYIGIISAACFFGGITIYLAAVEYEHALRGPDAVITTIGIGGSLAAWVSAVFGVLTIGSIIFRSFDVPQPEASQNSGEGGANGAGGALRRRFNRNASAGTGSGGDEQGAGAGAHEKTRTLPAVPESVDLEASMMSMVQSRPRMAMNTAMKFAMAEQTSRPGGFVIRPDDQLALTFSVSNTPEMEERRDGQFESLGRSSRTKILQNTRAPPPAARGWPGCEREATMSIPQDVTESFGLTSLPMVGVGSSTGRPRPGYVDPSEDAQGHFRSNDTTLAEYPSFDPRVIRAANGEPTTPPRGSVRSPKNSPKVAQQEACSASPVLKRHSRRRDSVGGEAETPASKIAREWAQSQYIAAPLPEPPSEGGASGDTTMGEGTWLGELEGSPPVSPKSTPSRPARDLRRLLGSRGSET